MRLSAAALALTLVASPASAQIVCYADISAGKTVTTSSLSGPITGPVTIAADGLIGGLGAGCDYRLDRVLVGALARYDLADVSSTLATGRISADDQWSIAARVGYYLTPGVLAYALAGVARLDLSYPAALPSGSQNSPLYGAGLEIDIGVPNISAYAEWNRVQGKTRTDELTASSVEPNSDTVRVGVRIKFGSIQRSKE